MTQAMRDTLHELGWNDSLIDSFIPTANDVDQELAKIELIAECVPTIDVTEITVSVDDLV